MERSNGKGPVLCEREAGTGFNIYKVRGSRYTAVLDGGKVSHDFLRDTDFLILNRCSPDRMEGMRNILDLNPDIQIIGTKVTLNFTQEFLGRTFQKRMIRDGDCLDLGDVTLHFVCVPNITWSRHQNRTWRKAYKFLQMPNWQWIDSLYTYIPEEKTVFSGQTFSAKDGSRRTMYLEDLALFREQVKKAVERIRQLDAETIRPEKGRALSLRTAVSEYQEWIDERNTETGNKQAVVLYRSDFGCTKQLAEWVAKGIEKNRDLEVSLISLAESPENLKDLLYRADGIAMGVPTNQEDCEKSMRLLTAELSPSYCRGKLGMAFGSFSYQPKGVSNMLRRMEQLQMRVLKEDFSVRFQPQPEELERAEFLGEHFGKCILAGEVLPILEMPAEEHINRIETNRRFVIIGNGAAGTTAAEELRKRDRTCTIEIIGDEPLPGYNRQMLTKGVLNEISHKNMMLRPRDWYEKQQIDVTLLAAAERIDPDKKQVFLSDGTDRRYDKLIIATGAEPAIPDIRGTEKQGVFTIHKVEAVDKMRTYLRESQARDIVIAGGGILGMETVAELSGSGMNLTIVDSAPFLMASQLDPKAGGLLAEAVEKKGIRVRVSAEISEILGGGSVSGVKLESGEILKAQAVIVCAGIWENGRILLENQSGAIVVDEKMRTKVKDVYACGDCAAFRGVNYGLWTQAVEMAKVAAANAAGEDARYRPVVPAVTYAGLGLSLFAIGDTGKDREVFYAAKELDLPQQKIYKKLYFRNEKFCGGVLLGDVDMAPELVKAYEEKSAISELKL